MESFDLAGMLATALVAALVLQGFAALACYSSADAYAVEVVLSKPGVGYDLSKLAEMEGVASVDYFGAYSAYAYRSHYDGRLVVVVSEQGLKYASVETSASEPVIAFVVRGLDVDPRQVSDNVEKARGELGWSVETLPAPGKGIGFVFTKTIDGAEVEAFLGVLEPAEEEEGDEGYTVKLSLLVRGAEEIGEELASKIKLEVESLLDEIGLPQLKELLEADLLEGSLPGRPPEQEKYLAVRIQMPLKQEATTTTVHACSISGRFDLPELRFEEARKLGWSVWVERATEDHYYVGFAMSKSLGYATLYVEGKGRDGELYLSLRVEGVSSLSDAVLGEFKKVFKAVGLGEDLVGKCSFEKFEESRGRFVPAYDVSEEDIREALRAELKWLSESGVISGLSEDDIETIASTAELGYAGWNGRLVWSEGRWVPYSSTEGAVVLRCVGVPPSFFPEEELGKPEGQIPCSELASGSQEGALRAALYLAVSLAAALLAGVAAYLAVRRRLPIEK